MMLPAEVDAWNALHPVGTLVEVRPAVSGTPYLTRTSTPLRLWGSSEVLGLKHGHTVTLDCVRLVEQKCSDTFGRAYHQPVSDR